jgi:3-dehydroquinate synthase
LIQKKTFRFAQASVDYYFAGGMAHLKQFVDPRTTVLITDENVFGRHEKRFKNWSTIVLKPGEAFKVQATVDSVVQQLIELGADRKWTLVGIGGGVITDLTGYVASVYLRGISFGFIPTTLLALVDASIGGKNGIDVGVYKNMVGIIRQPSFILHDLAFLNTLPEKEWRNGFAEIIKHACIRDAAMFRELEEKSFDDYRKKKTALCNLIQRNALLKTKVVQQDEFEQGDRKLLNFGHTLGHALENRYELMHGEAVSIGMAFAARLSRELLGFRHEQRVVSLIRKYGLPITADYNAEETFEVLKGDKKKESSYMNFILLRSIGKGVIEKIPLDQLYQAISCRQ